jgi:hypothetical protein
MVGFLLLLIMLMAAAMLLLTVKARRRTENRRARLRRILIAQGRTDTLRACEDIWQAEDAANDPQPFMDPDYYIDSDDDISYRDYRGMRP